VAVQSNAQREIQLLAEWLTQLPPFFKSKTHVRVGQETLVYNGQTLTPALTAALLVWSDWADARVYTGSEVWIVEAKLVGTADGYGQVLSYCSEYPTSADYRQFYPAPIVPVVLAAARKEKTASYFAQFGVRTVIFAPSWSLRSIASKIVGDTTEL
jgi:hypothetical protein